MAWQLIYTSAPRGLVPGRSGFCTVARHREIRDGLVTAIERFSQYDRAGRSGGTQSPVVYAHRIVRLGGSSYHVLSYTGDAGADYTGRTNHLAHHLICEPRELANAPSPAEVLRQMAWRRTWSDAPRYFGPEEAVDLQRFHRTAGLPAQTWQTVTGDAGCAALPLESGALAGCHWLYPAAAGEQYLLPLFAESLLLLDPPGRSADKLWHVPFTTYLQSTDHAADFFWRGCWQGSPAALAAQGARQTFDFTQPRNLRPPENKAAERARTGRTAAAETVKVAAVAVEAPVEAARPASPASSAGQELDLDALLASADDAGSTGRRWARRKATVAAGKSVIAKTAEARRFPVKAIVGAGVAILICGVLAMGFLAWRDGKAEQMRSELTRLRHGGEFAKGRERTASIGETLRGYKPLKTEIERTLVAAELADLKGKTPEEAGKFLIANRERLAAPEIRDEFQLKDLLGKIERWHAADAKVSDLHISITTATFREPNAGEDRKKKFTEVEKAVAALTAPYRPTDTITNRLAGTKRLFVNRRFEALQRAITEGAAPATLDAILADLTKDAESFGVSAELKSRIEQFDRQRNQPPSGPKSESPGPPDLPAAAPVIAKAGEAKNPLGLPQMTTYIATAPATVTDYYVSGVKEIGSVFPADGKWLLYRAPQPAFDPQDGKPEACSIVGGKKIYDAKNGELFSLQPPQLMLSALAKDALRESFLLRFTPEDSAEKGFQIFFQRGDQKSPGLFPLPLAGSLEWDRKRGSVTLSAEAVGALSRIKVAAAERRLVLRAEGLGKREVPIPLEADTAVPLNLLPVIEAIEWEMKARKSPTQPSIIISDEERVRSAHAARELLMGEKDPTKLSRAGLEVFGGPVDPLAKVDRLATTDSYVKSLEGLAKGKLKDGRAYVEYTHELFIALGARIENKIGAKQAEEKKLDQTKDGPKKTELLKEINALKKEQEAVKSIEQSLEDELRVGGFSKARCVKVIKIWESLSALQKFKSGPVKEFRDKWKDIFTKANIETILPFLEWNLADKNDGDLDQEFTRVRDKKAPVVPVVDELADLQRRLQTDFFSLASFTIDLKTADGKAIRLVNFVGGPRVEVAEPGKKSK